MKKILKGAILSLIFLNFLCCKGYSLNDREKPGLQPAQSQPPQVQNQQPPRPMLPPIVPSPSPGISPTPSPQITNPSVMSATISIPSSSMGSHPGVMQTNFQSSPAQAVLPAGNISTELPNVLIIGNSLGKVVNIGAEKGALPWIEVKDGIFNETIRIKINPESTPVVRKSNSLNYLDIKIGDTVNVIFNQQGEDVLANFVSILTEEDLKAMEEDLKAGSNLKTGNESDDNPVPASE